MEEGQAGRYNLDPPIVGRENTGKGSVAEEHVLPNPRSRLTENPGPGFLERACALFDSTRPHASSKVVSAAIEHASASPPRTEFRRKREGQAEAASESHL